MKKFMFLKKQFPIIVVLTIFSVLTLSLFSLVKNPTPINAQTPAASSIYAKFDGIDGESTDTGHKDWIDVISMSHSIISPDDASRKSGDVAMEELTLVKELDKSTPLLAKSASTGLLLPAVQFVALTNNPDGTQSYLKYELENVMITNYSLGGNSSGQLPTESISLNYEKIKITYLRDKYSSESMWSRILRRMHVKDSIGG